MEADVKTDTSLFKISDEPEKISSFTRILYDKAVLVETEKEKVEETPVAKFKSFRSCFNCGEEHNLRDCTKPYNPGRIARNRAQFSRSARGSEFTRYHLEIDDRFAHFRPGIISKRLRTALGVGKDRLPRYIYNMRRLGYPPGWLEEAKISHSGINMLDSNGERVPDPDEEEGEICSTRVKYDITKIVEYPGFNVWPDPGTINETDFYESLPMCYEQSREVFVDRLNEANNSQQVAPVKAPPSGRPGKQNDDMEVEDLDPEIKYDNDENAKFGFVPPLPLENRPSQPAPPPEDLPQLPLDDDKEIESGEDVSSEEEEGELPCRTAKVGKGKVPEKNGKTTRDDGKMKVTRDDDSPEESTKKVQPSTSSFYDAGSWPNDEDVSTEVTYDTISLKSYDSITENDTSTNTFGRVKSVEFGTPSLSHSSYKALPSPEKFRKDISDVIYFENLPNSTGKYERLKGLLKTVRSKVIAIRGGSNTDGKK